LLLPSYPSFATICGKINFDDIIKSCVIYSTVCKDRQKTC
jgi:hypothetical protein